MKTYKFYNKIFLIIAGTLFLFAACKESISEREDSPIVPENCQGVYFPATNPAVVELEPTEPTQISITVARTDSTSAVEVPVTVETNTDNVFAVPQKAVFAAGAKTTTLTVTFPTAGVGTTYNLKLSVSGDEYVNKYASTVPYVTTSVTRIKWNTTDEPFIYIDGTFLALWGVSQWPMYVEAEMAEVGGAVRYRFKNAYKVSISGRWEDDEYIPDDDDGIYNGYPYNYPGDVDESQDYYIIIEIDNNGNVTMEPSELGVDWNYGMFSIGSAIYSNLPSQNPDTNYPLGTVEKGEEGNVITFPKNSLYVSMANLSSGRPYSCETPTIIYTTKAAYLADNMKIENFNEIEYEEIEGAVSEFESAAYSESWNQTFFKAVDIDPDNEDSEYKDLYYLADVYEESFGLAFYYNGKAVSIPAKQQTGTKMLGKDVYVSQSETVESGVTTNNKGVEIYTLGLKFHYEDGTVLGEFAEVFYYSKDLVSYELSDFYGDFVMTGVSVFDGNDTEMNVNIAAGTTPNTFVITGIDYAESVEATFDPQTSVMSIEPQYLPDYVAPSGNVFDMTLYTYTESGSVSESASMSFTFNMSGQLVLTSTSDAVGYLLDSEAAGGYVDGYYDLIFTPHVTTRSMAMASSAVVLRPVNKLLNAVAVTKSPKSLGNSNFAIQEKLSPKKASLKNSVRTPLF